MLVKTASEMDLEFRVITPYEGQRSMIEGLLKKSDLPYEDRVFNVDSFQGNEADIIIISLVRTNLTGFLANLRRINVMLTRCKVAMFICCKMEFLKDKARDTLVGKMATEWLESNEPVTKVAGRQEVNWNSLFKNLKKNNSIKITFSKETRNKQKVDLSKIQYGTRLQKPSTTHKGNGRGQRMDNKARIDRKKKNHNQHPLNPSLSRRGRSQADDYEEGRKRDTWGDRSDDWGSWSNSVQNDVNEAASGWDEHAEWKAEGW